MLAFPEQLTMRLKWVFAVVLCGSVAAGLTWRDDMMQVVSKAMAAAGRSGGAGTEAAASHAGRTRPAPTVSTALATLGDLPIERHTFGKVQAADSTDLTSRAQGIITRIAVADGADVKAGDLLVKLDDRALVDTRDKDRATLAKDRATLFELGGELERNKALQAKGAASQQTFDRAEAAQKVAAANVQADEATVRGDEVAIADTEIRAPYAGRLGAFGESVGALVSPGTTIVRLTKMAPVEVGFTLPQDALSMMRGAVADRSGTVDVRADGGGPVHASVDFIDNQIDPASGTFGARATVANKDLALWPGEAVDLTVTLGRHRNVVLVPTVAVQPAAEGSIVFVVTPGKKVDVRKVEPVGPGRRPDGDRLRAQGGRARRRRRTVAARGRHGRQGRGRGRRAAPHGEGRQAGGCRGAQLMIPEFCIRRPVATILLAIGLVMAGIAGYRLLPVAALPQVDYPTISVTAQLSGASPDTMATAVATPLIKQFETIPGIDTISATSSLGNSQIVLQFDLGRDIDAAAADVQAAITRTQRQLPDNMTTPPSYRKVNPADAPILLLAVQSDTMPLSELDSIAENIISPSLSTIGGVAQVSVFGGQTYAVRVEVDPAKLAARNMGLDTVAKAISAANDQTPVGSLQNKSQLLSIRSDTQLTDAGQFRTLIVSDAGGNPVRLEDVARVKDSVENDKTASWYDGRRSIVLALQRQPDANTVAVVDAVKQRLPSLASEIPASVKVNVMNDRSTSIRASIHDMQTTLAITIGLVILVIFLFLGRLTTTIIPGLAVPLSLIATFGAMYVLGYSLDNISLLGLTLSVGLVVDDAIVMLENIIRHVEEGLKPFEAALVGAREVSWTIVSMSVSLIAVFIPILLMGGVVGKLFNEFGMVVALAIIASAFVSLTVTPMMAARLPARHGEAPRGLAAAFDWGYRRTLKAYDYSVGWCIRHRAVVMLVFLSTVAASGYLFSTLPSSFFPTEDIGQLSISTEARQDISFPAMSALQQEVAAVVGKDPAVDHVTSIVGGGFHSAVNSGTMFVQLKDKSVPSAARRDPDGTAPEARAHRRHPHLHHAGPEPALRRTVLEEPVPARRPVARPQQARHLGRQAGGGDGRRSASDRRRQRPGERGAPGQRRRRPRPRLDARHHRGGAAAGARGRLRRLTPWRRSSRPETATTSYWNTIRRCPGATRCSRTSASRPPRASSCRWRASPMSCARPARSP